LKIKHLIILAITILNSCVVSASHDRTSQVDSVFERWNNFTSPGCAVGIMKDGHVVLEKAYGMADLQHEIPNTIETVFENGSVSKQFTAAAIVLLALEGKITLDDDVRYYIPEVPDYGTGVQSLPSLDGQDMNAAIITVTF
jgi:CubicO group peptidase (beta-lactamase class C family)